MRTQHYYYAIIIEVTGVGENDPPVAVRRSSTAFINEQHARNRYGDRFVCMDTTEVAYTLTQKPSGDSMVARYVLE